MKRILSLTLAFVLLFSGLAFGFSIEPIRMPIEVNQIKQPDNIIFDKVKAESLVREYFNLGKDFELEEAVFQEAYEGQERLWRLVFTNKESVSYNAVSAVIDGATGEVKSFSHYVDWELRRKTIPTFTREEAKAEALDFIKKFYPKLVSSLKEEENYRTFSISDRYNFTFGRYEHGIKVDKDFINIAVDSGNGSVVEFHIKWAKEPIVKPNNLLTEGQVLEKYLGQGNIELIWILYKGKKDTEAKMIPVYSYTQKESGYIHGVTGELINNNDIFGGFYPIRYGQARQAMDAKNEGEAYLPETKPEEGYLSREKAVELAKKFFRPVISFEKLNLSGAYYSVGYENKDQRLWRLNWISEDEDYSKRIYMGLTMDAKDGRVIDFNINWNKEVGRRDGKLNDLFYTNTAKTFVDKLFPGTSNQLKYKVNENTFTFDRQGSGLLNVQGNRMFHGIPYPQDGFWFTMGYDGTITSVSYRWSDVKTPEKPTVVTLERGSRSFYSNTGFELMFLQLKGEKEWIPGEFISVWGLKQRNFNYINAITGEPLDRVTINEKPKAIKLVDIENHWAKREIQILFDQGIIQTEKEFFSPYQGLTRGEAVKMIMLAWGGYSRIPSKPSFEDVATDNPYFNYVEMALSAGFIKGGSKFRPNEGITREEFTEILVRQMGYGQVGEIQGIFTVDYTDKANISPNKLGFIALAKGFNLYHGNPQFISPKGIVQRGEVAYSLYNSLSVRIVR